MTRRIGTAFAVTACALAAAPSACALELVREGSALVFRGSPGEVNHLSVSEDTFESFTSKLHFADRGEFPIQADPAIGCEIRRSTWGGFADCPYEGVTEVRLEGGDGNDVMVLNATDMLPVRVVLDGGPGDDEIDGPGNDYPSVLLGGDGSDKLRGGAGDDEIDAGPGNDVAMGQDGDDQVRGGEGDDQLTGGPRVDRDVIDGGPGRDRSVNDWSDTDDVTRPPIWVSLDGRPNDGRRGEGDNVTGVETFEVNLTATFRAGGDPVEFVVNRSIEGPGSRITGSPGADRLAGYTDDDVIEGRGGSDAIFAGMGDDRVLARDGVKDTIDCAEGADTVIADRIDTVANCERVDTGGRKKGKKGRKGKRG
ncbi:MAG TPA: calcium-binding protein [Capillimicrobium sp.]